MLTMPAWRRVVALPILIALLSAGILVAISATAPSAHAGGKRDAKVAKIKDAYKIARAQKGDPYNYGSDGPNAFDCSGLTQYSFGRAGISIPRVSSDQADFARRLKNKTNIKRGDFMFFDSGSGVYHMGLFTGRWNSGRRVILHASTSGTPVKTDPLWTGDWYAGTLRPQRR